jgi:hypothetical protein
MHQIGSGVPTGLSVRCRTVWWVGTFDSPLLSVALHKVGEILGLTLHRGALGRLHSGLKCQGHHPLIEDETPSGPDTPLLRLVECL